MIITLWYAMLASHGERVSPTGAWVLPDSFQYHVDANLSAALTSFMTRHVLRTAFDIGAGTGAYAKTLRKAGYPTEAIDGVANIESLSGGYVHTHDLTTPLKPCKSFDLVLSLEVAEHIPKEYESVYLENLACSTKKFLIISWAPPGQPGSGHVNLVKQPEVRQKLKEKGFRYRPLDSINLRAQASLPWFRRNLCVFSKINFSTTNPSRRA